MGFKKKHLKIYARHYCGYPHVASPAGKKGGPTFHLSPKGYSCVTLFLPLPQTVTHKWKSGEDASMNGDLPHRQDTMQPPNVVDKPASKVVYALVQNDGQFVKASSALQEVITSWPSVEVWWKQVVLHSSSPAPTQCPTCQLGQRLGVVRACILESNNTASPHAYQQNLRTFEITYSGHPHILDENTTNDLILIRDITQEQEQKESTRHKINQYESICTFIQDVYYRTDMHGTILFISPSCYKLLYYQPEELLGSPFADLATTPEFFQELLDILENTRAVHDYYLLMHCKKGRQIPVSLTAKLVIGQDGQRLAIEGIFRDISERERLDTLLEERSLTYREALRHLENLNAAANQHVMVSIVNPKGDIISVNEKFLEISRYDKTEIIGKSHHILNSDHHPKSFFKEMWRTILGGAIWHGEIRNRKKNGDLFWVDCSIVPFLTPLGQPFQFIFVGTDISNLVRTRTRLERNREFLHRVIKSMGEGVIVMDLQGRLLSLNTEGERLLGWQEAELMHKNVHETIHNQRPDGRVISTEECTVHQSLLGRSFRVEDDFYLRKDGTFLPVSHVTAPLRNEKEIVGSIAIFRDNARFRKRHHALEQLRDSALESARLKSEFLANMSHEIRTPMNAIIGMNDLLMDTKLNEEQKDFTEIIGDSAKSLLSLINDILDFSKIEAGKMDMDEIEFSLVSVIEGCAELLASQAHEKALSLTTFISPHIPQVLKGDSGRLRQMVLNLIGNALKFTDEGEVVIRVQPESKRPQENAPDKQMMIRFSVTDTGIGLPEKVRDQLFEPFTQADKSTTRKYGGTGLGLAISKRLAELMGGNIGVDTVIHPHFGEGTSFWFCIPFRYPSIDFPPIFPVQTNHQQDTPIVALFNSVTDQEILENYCQAWGLVYQGQVDRERKFLHLQEVFEDSESCSLAIVALSSSDMNHPLWLAMEQNRPLPDSLKLVALLDKEDKRLRARLLDFGFTTCLVKPVRQEEWIHCLTQSTPLDEANHLLETAEAAGEGSHKKSPIRNPNAYDALESGKLLLLVEDNPVNQKVTLLQLKKLGYAAHAVNNGREAVEAVTNLPYALILMDCQMPIMDGFEATHTIRKMHESGGNRSSWQHIPIIAMTANAMKGDRERCLQAGMDDYLSKPVSPETLLKKLQYWIPQGANKLPPIEIQQLRQLFGNDDAMIHELLHHFPPSARELLNRLWQGVRETNQTLLNDTAFELQEACANMGATGMAALTRTLEHAAAKEEWEKATLAMEQLEQALQKVEIYVRDY